MAFCTGWGCPAFEEGASAKQIKRFCLASVTLCPPLGTNYTSVHLNPPTVYLLSQLWLRPHALSLEVNCGPHLSRPDTVCYKVCYFILGLRGNIWGKSQAWNAKKKLSTSSTLSFPKPSFSLSLHVPESTVLQKMEWRGWEVILHRIYLQWKNDDAVCRLVQIIN